MDKTLYSDVNLKENIERIPSRILDRVFGVIFKKFNFKNDEEQRNYYGVIAQELQELGLDDVVVTDESGNLKVDYTSLLCIKCAQLSQELNILKHTCINLQDEINNLKEK